MEADEKRPGNEVKDKPRGRRRWPWLFGAAALLVVGVLAAVYSVQRWALHNFHEVVPGQVYRCSQPGEEQLRQWKQAYGLRTVVNLRSDTYKDVVKEEAGQVQALGMKYVHLPMIVNRLPTRAELARLIDVIETAERPVLLHCQAGADRTSLAGMIAAMVVGGQTYDRARGQISIRYLHFDWNPRHVTGVPGLYEKHCAEKGVGTDGWGQFKDWALNVYKPPA